MDVLYLSFPHEDVILLDVVHEKQSVDQECNPFKQVRVCYVNFIGCDLAEGGYYLKVDSKEGQILFSRDLVFVAAVYLKLDSHVKKIVSFDKSHQSD